MNSRMSVCLCERGARIHASPRLAYCANFGQEAPVHTTLCICRLCVIRDHYIPSPFIGRGISPLILQQQTGKNKKGKTQGTDRQIVQ